MKRTLEITMIEAAMNDFAPTENKGHRAIRREWINFMLQDTFPWTLSQIKKAVRFYELR